MFNGRERGEREREKEQACTAWAMHAIDRVAWVYNQLKPKSKNVLNEQQLIFL
jgi:hypothetical protein